MYVDGVASERVYLVKYDEIVWNQLTKEQIGLYTSKWEREAQDAKCVRLAVRVMPDSLFGEGKPYIAVQRDFDYEPWRLSVHVTVKLRHDTELPRVRTGMLHRLRIAYGNGTKYEIVDHTGKVQETGVV